MIPRAKGFAQAANGSDDLYWYILKARNHAALFNSQYAILRLDFEEENAAARRDER
jgi:hypothetical protein